MKNKLPFDTYQTDGITLARRLLGCRLMHRTAEGLCGGIIVETEAYMGLTDDAAHSYRGNPNGRVNVQYGPGGFAYIYLIYGMHSCMNVVANDSRTPEAVLISVGSNSYGHPTEETLRRVAERGCGIYRTDFQGTLHLPIN